MAKIAFVPRALADVDRVFTFYARDDAELAAAQVEAIAEAIGILAHHPLVGRPLRDGVRELIISRGRSGFVALYRFSPRDELVRILRIRHQRESGYPR